MAASAASTRWRSAVPRSAAPPTISSTCSTRRYRGTTPRSFPDRRATCCAISARRTASTSTASACPSTCWARGTWCRSGRARWSSTPPERGAAAAPISSLSRAQWNEAATDTEGRAVAFVLGRDFGGTRSRVALFETQQGTLPRLVQSTIYVAREFGGVAEIVARFVGEQGAPSIAAACLGVAGAVDGNRVKLTNLGWEVDGAALAAQLGFPLELINDLVATAL